MFNENEYDVEAFVVYVPLQLQRSIDIPLEDALAVNICELGVFQDTSNVHILIPQRILVTYINFILHQYLFAFIHFHTCQAQVGFQ